MDDTHLRRVIWDLRLSMECLRFHLGADNPELSMTRALVNDLARSVEVVVKAIGKAPELGQHPEGE
jgi:hypothetical protein